MNSLKVLLILLMLTGNKLCFAQANDSIPNRSIPRVSIDKKTMKEYKAKEDQRKKQEQELTIKNQEKVKIREDSLKQWWIMKQEEFIRDVERDSGKVLMRKRQGGGD